MLVASLAFSLMLPVVAFGATAVPFISQPPVPSSAAPGGSGFTLTINGTGFASNATVNWAFLSGGTLTTVPLTTTCTIATQCTASVPFNLITTAGTASITVVQGSPALTSNVVFLPVTNATLTVTANKTDFAVGNNPNSVAVADFNGDGIPDLAVTNNLDNTVSILLGNGDGTFKAQTTYPTGSGSGPLAVIAADFNNDGHMDLAIVENKGSKVSILLGNGDGTFQAHSDFATGASPTSLAAGDFNGDGNLDLVVTNSGADSVSILLGNGDGTFKPKTDISIGTGSGPSGLAIGDVNRDGFLDLVVADKTSGNISILLGNGNGTFQAPVAYPANKLPTSVVVADFNNDGKPDVVATDSGANTISVFLGNGDGTFQAAVGYSAGNSPSRAVVGDFNGDGLLDVTITDTSSGLVTMLLGNGNGTFQSPMSFPTGTGPIGMAVGDFNGDGRLDLAVVDSTANTVSIELQSAVVSLVPTSLAFGNQNVGTTSTPAKTVTLTNNGSAPLEIQSIAFTGPNSGDFSQTNNCGTSVEGGSNCTIQVTFTPAAPGIRSAQLAVTDNAKNSPQTVNVTGTGISTTGPAASLSPASLTFAAQAVGTTSPPQAVTLANFGSLPLAITSIVASPADFGQSNTCPASLGSGANCTINVTFAPTTTGTRIGTLTATDNDSSVPGSTQVVNLTGTGTNPAFVPVPQIDQPLVPDTVAPGSAAFTLTINGAEFFTNATVTWTLVSGATVTTTSLPASCPVTTQCTVSVPANLVSAAGTAAVTVVNPGSPGRTSNVVLFPIGNLLSEVGLSETDYAAGNNPQSVAVADFTGTGLMDVAVANNSDNTVSIFIGNGDGTFPVAAAPTYPTGNGPQSVIAADFNNDGKQDLAVVNNIDNTVSILLGNGDGTFQAKQDFATGLGPTAVAAGDFNGDGNLDLVVTDSTAGTVSILLGNGDGTFQAKSDISTGTGSGPTAVAVADINHDGLLDLVVADKSNGKISILLGKGDGTFQAHVDLTSGTAPSSVVVADFNRDGKPDVLVLNSGSNALAFFAGNGDGTFQTPVPVSLTGGSGPAQILVEDFNSDGALDVAVTGTTAGTVSVLLGNGDGTFGSPLDFSTGSGPSGVAAGDFNGDGRIDLVTADSTAAKISIELQGPGVGLSASSLSFGTQRVMTTSAAQSVVLTNTGSTTLNLQSIAISGSFALAYGGSFTYCIKPPATTGTLAAGASCTISATFTPTTSGVSTGQLTINDNAPGSPQSVALTGTGTAPAVTVTPTPPFRYLPLDVGQTSVAQTATITNSGTDTLNFSSITVSSSFYESTDCLASPANLAPGASCHISISFQPLATGALSGSVTINDDAPDTPQSIGLTGTGVEPTATLSSSSLSFGNQMVNTAAATQSTTITNSGTGPLLITNLSITGPNSTDFTQTNTCGTQVGGNGASCTITVTFTPTAVGPRLAAVTIVDNNNGINGNQDVVQLSGVGIAPVVSLSTNSIGFNPQTVGSTSAPYILTLSNNGTAPLTVASVVSSSVEFGQGNNCTTPVAVGGSCTINVTFTPSAAGTRSGTITITDNDGGNSGSTQKITLTGTGVQASLSISPSSLSFGNQVVGTTSSGKTLTVTNNGQGTDTINSIVAVPTPTFAETNTCGSSLPAMGSCTVTVTFTPKTSGPFNGVLSIQDTAPGNPHSANLSGAGSDFAIGVTPTSATVSAGNSTPFTIQVTPNGGFNQQVTLSCSNLPSLSNCSFSPSATVTLDGTDTVNVTMTVSTTAPSLLLPVGGINRRPPNAWKFRLPLPAPSRFVVGVSLLVVWLVAAAMLAGWLGMVRRGRRPAPLRTGLRWGFSMAVLALLLTASIALPACGGGGGTPLPHPGTPTGTYSLSVSGASGSISHSTTVTLVVD